MKRKSELAILAGIIVASCATIDVPTPALREAREAVRAAHTDAAVQAGAPLELRRATEALDRADRALVNGEPPREIDHYAYVATRRAHTAMALAAAKTDEGAIKTVEVDRERGTDRRRANAGGGCAERGRAVACAGAGRGSPGGRVAATIG